jgi:hypothetical protein
LAAFNRDCVGDENYQSLGGRSAARRQQVVAVKANAPADGVQPRPVAVTILFREPVINTAVGLDKD